MVRVSVKTSMAALVCFAVAAGVPALAQEAKPADAPVTWAPAPNSVVNPSKNIALSGWESYKGKFTKRSVDENLQDPVLKGAIDIHAHFGPDTYARQWDAFEIAKLAKARGMRGIVLKNHWTESAGTAYLVRKYAGAEGLEVFGGLALNATVGGVNPQAVRYFAEVEGNYAKIVWMPSHDSEKEVKFLKDARPYVIVSQNGVLLPSVLGVLDLIAQYKLTLATGHVNPVEMLQIVSEARKRGIDRIIITHPGLGPMFTDPTIEQLKKATAMGAYAEIVTAELGGALREATIKAIRAVGPANCIVSSDSGLTGSRNHPDALVVAARVLREAGFTEADLTLMFKTNPAKVLGLPLL
ncbi:hypothetical protein FHS91_000245 [Sphingobium xanthum]|uniref:DUF6282 family protein n=1 Tax=Sphingobium xanthum TaxID=1387165 RepID=UPI001C8B54C0|nr:DUF6282 family protein [Sphingobium xanthum]